MKDKEKSGSFAFLCPEDIRTKKRRQTERHLVLVLFDCCSKRKDKDQISVSNFLFSFES